MYAWPPLRRYSPATSASSRRVQRGANRCAPGDCRPCHCHSATSDRQASHPGIHLSREAGETDEYQSLAKGVGKGGDYRFPLAYPVRHKPGAVTGNGRLGLGRDGTTLCAHGPEHLAEDSAKIESILEKVCPHGTNTSQPHFFALPKKDGNRLIYMVPRDGIEPPTRGFSVLCSTD